MVCPIPQGDHKYFTDKCFVNCPTHLCHVTDDIELVHKPLMCDTVRKGLDKVLTDAGLLH